MSLFFFVRELKTVCTIVYKLWPRGGIVMCILLLWLLLLYATHRFYIAKIVSKRCHRCLLFRQIRTNFQDSFITRPRSKFVMKSLLKLPSHLKHIATWDAWHTFDPPWTMARFLQVILYVVRVCWRWVRYVDWMHFVSVICMIAIAFYLYSS